MQTFSLPSYYVSNKNSHFTSPLFFCTSISNNTEEPKHYFYPIFPLFSYTTSFSNNFKELRHHFSHAVLSKCITKSNNSIQSSKQVFLTLKLSNFVYTPSEHNISRARLSHRSLAHSHPKTKQLYPNKLNPTLSVPSFPFLCLLANSRAPCITEAGNNNYDALNPAGHNATSSPLRGRAGQPRTMDDPRDSDLHNVYKSFVNLGLT